ncbi:MAG TPA: PKD domain-containing protein, partial [Flavobacteriales bacterium]|nr:PKD domain-containing protein [Flavobacteriales bacterium]
MARLTQQDRPRRSGPRAGKEILLCLLVWALPFLANGQAFEIFNGTELTCSGAFLDSGGQGGSGYGNNENYTYTLCPDNPGDAISVDMLTFDLSTAGPAPIDMLTVYDGNSTAAPVLGSYTGNSLQGQIVSATSSNGSGCLTFVFNSNSSGTGIFAGTISCYVPCTRPVAAVDIGFQPPALICPGETVNFDGSPSTSAPGTQLVSYVWDFADGTTLTTPTPQASHTFTAVGEHLVQLQVIDDNGCSSVNLTDVAVRVGTAPTFTGTQGDLVGCLGEPLCLDGVVVPTTWNELPEADFGDGVYLPDNVGDCFTSDLFFTQFAPGQTLTNINQLLTICLDIEHSFIGDLVISVTSPSGENVILHQQGGGSTFLGDANDLDNNINPVPGTCWTYCFSPTASNGTWVDNSQLGATPNVVNASQGASLAPGTYESVQSLNGLVGAQLNGTWTIEVCDLWAADNGFLCSWNIDFDPSLFPDLTEFTPVYGAGCDSSYWSGPGIVQTGPDCNSICTSPGSTGDHDLTFTVTDNFGCTYDTVITVTVIPDPTVDAAPDQTTCDDPVQLNAQASGGLSTNCTYTLEQFDSYGDGWNGGQLTITVDGVPTSYTLSNGSSGTVSIPVAHGVPIQLSWQPGSFNGEVSFDLLDAGGNVVYSAGPGPASGTLWSGTTDCGPQAATFIYSWDPPTGLSDPSIADPIATVGATTTYCVTVTQAGHPECSATDCVTITVDAGVSAGTDAAVDLCAMDPAVDLFTLLGGADTGGTWTDPLNGPSPGLVDPASDPSGDYLYVVMGTGTCTATDTAVVTVNITAPPFAGNDAAVALCSSDAPVDLSTLIGAADPGGSWTGPGGVAFSGTLDPASDPAGDYTYTVAGTAPCPDDLAVVSVVINTPPFAGNDAAITLCSSDAPADLSTLIGAADPGGSWTGPGGVAFSGTLDPASDPAGDYTYTVAGTAPCPDDLAVVSVVINTPPFAGN